MPVASVRDEGICVRHWDWSETSQTVSILTRQHGLLRGLAKGSRRERGAFSGGIELLTRGQVQAIIKTRTALATLTSWDLLDPYRGLRESLGAFYGGTYAADLVGHLVLDDDPHPELFDSLNELLAWLSGNSQAAAGEHALHVLRFQWELLDAIGTKPELDRDVRSGHALVSEPVFGFSPTLGGFQALSATNDAWRVRRETHFVLGRIRAGSMEGLDAGSVLRAGRLLASYIHHIVGAELTSTSPLFDYFIRFSRSGSINRGSVLADEPEGRGANPGL